MLKSWWLTLCYLRQHAPASATPGAVTREPPGTPHVPQVIQPAAGVPLELELYPINLRLLRHQAAPAARGTPSSWSGSVGGYSGVPLGEALSPPSTRLAPHSGWPVSSVCVFLCVCVYVRTRPAWILTTAQPWSLGLVFRLWCFNCGHAFLLLSIDTVTSKVSVRVWMYLIQYLYFVVCLLFLDYTLTYGLPIGT